MPIDELPDRRALTRRSRLRNRRALVMSIGLLLFAGLCVVLVAPGAFSSSTAPERKAKPKAKAVAPMTAHTVGHTTPPPPTTTSTRSTTTSTSSSTSTTTSSSTTTTTSSSTTSTTAPDTTTAVPVTSVAARVSDTPQWCTVIVTLSNGVHRSYPLAAYVANVGDQYVFTASLGGYHVVVTTTVGERNGHPECSAGLSHLSNQ